MLQSTMGNHSDTKVDLLLIGPITQDLVGQERESAYTLGGTVTFAAITALRLGRSPTILSSVAAHTDLSELPTDIDLHILPSPTTTTFANVYHEDSRIQYCYAQSSAIYADNVLPALRSPHVALLGPLADEVDASVAAIFDPNTLVAVVPQGWMRRWDESGRVFSKPWENEADILPHLDVLVLSQEDIDYDLSRLERAFELVPLVVMTEYRDGSTIYIRRENGELESVKVPPRRADEVDPTGAGDVFATAFLLRLQETGDPIQSARFANITASFGVESQGVLGIPSREMVLSYMEDHPF